MASVNLTIKYRPIRIGFLVRDGSIEDLVKAAGINTLLWGGIYNPLIPVGTENEFAEQLMNLFSIDVLFPVNHTKEIDELIKKYPFLRIPEHYAQNIFYEDYYTKKNILGYLSSMNIVDYWKKEFEHKHKEYKSNCVLVKWGNNDELKNLFSLIFGYFPKEYNLRDDFENAFLKGLRAKEVKIPIDNSIDKELANTIYPIKLTGLELYGYGGTWRGDGIYIGDENDFYDLLYFWNLRASGLFVEFLPKGKIERFKEFIEATLEKLDNTPNRNPNIENWINIYYRISHEEVKNIIKEFKSKKRFVFSHCDEIIWNGLNIKPTDFYFGWEQVLASVDKFYDRYVVSINFPEKKFIINKNRNIGWEHLVVSISPIGEFGYPEHTLKPPFIRQLNEFYSREITFDPWKLRVEKDGIAIIIKTIDGSLTLSPISHQKIIHKIFELAGLKSEISQAGLIAKKIIEKLGGVDGCRVFKIEGVRKLFQTLKTNKSITRGEGKKMISDGGNFKRFENLYIEPREKAKLEADDVFDFLLKKDFLRPGLELICNHCKLSNWLSLRELDDVWTCKYCGGDNKTVLQLKDKVKLKFRKSGLFAKDNNQEGAIPVILTLLVFLRISDLSKFVYSPSLKLVGESKSCEIDFCVLQYGRRGKIQLAIGECKSKGGLIDQKDIENLKFVRDKIKNLNIDCYLVFSKTAEKFEQSEIELFKKLKEENIPIILLTNKELEAYHPYWENKELPKEYIYVFDMEQMSRNSLYLYVQEQKK